MVFIGGARQVGKTSLALHLAEAEFPLHDYLNWDAREDRRRILRAEFKGDARIVLFDEIHKYRDWKNYLKGLYDKHHSDFGILVTGSARLDVYRRGGDSLMGRYHHHRLHPFSLAEYLEGNNSPQPASEISFPQSGNKEREALESLLKFGGFPEPLVKQSERTLRRWHHERLDRLVREDVRDLENLRDLSALEVLVDLLPSRVGSLLSLNSLREDLQVAHKTVDHWLEVLERFYYHFRVYPYSDNRIKSLRKTPKLYLWDWSEVESPGARFENLVASHLLKLCHFLNDTEGYRTELYYLRDIEGREVDFLVSDGRKPWFAVEVKTSAKEMANTLSYFGQRLKIPFLFQVVMDKGIDVRRGEVRVISAERFLGGLV